MPPTRKDDPLVVALADVGREIRRNPDKYAPSDIIVATRGELICYAAGIVATIKALDERAAEHVNP